MDYSIGTRSMLVGVWCAHLSSQVTTCATVDECILHSPPAMDFAVAWRTAVVLLAALIEVVVHERIPIRYRLGVVNDH
jgi:hypothetical protein